MYKEINNMEEQLIIFETAKLAKEKGFDEFCVKCFNEQGMATSFTGYAIMKNYNKNSNIHLYDTSSEEFEYPKLKCTRPTQSLLQRWLREVHNIHLSVDFYYGAKIGEQYRITGDYKTFNQWTWIDGEYCVKHGSYEEALEVGLYQGLLLI